MFLGPQFSATTAGSKIKTKVSGFHLGYCDSHYRVVGRTGIIWYKNQRRKMAQIRNVQIFKSERSNSSYWLFVDEVSAWIRNCIKVRWASWFEINYYKSVNFLITFIYEKDLLKTYERNHLSIFLESFKGRVQCFSIQVGMNKRFFLNPEKQIRTDPSCRLREKRTQIPKKW